VGNEDEGRMSAWYILAASGLHPACPGSGVWILTSPVFSEVSFRLDPKYAKGGSFTIRANGVSKRNVYIRSAKLNGRRLDRAWITTNEVRNGGLLELEMGAEPATDAFPVRPPR
jgi:putative alpha-1,2-mannosidase